jgi:hypothetical protein
MERQRHERFARLRSTQPGTPNANGVGELLEQEIAGSSEQGMALRNSQSLRIRHDQGLFLFRCYTVLCTYEELISRTLTN